MPSEITLHVELMGQDRDLLERTCENLEWYRKHLQEQAQVQQEREAQQCGVSPLTAQVKVSSDLIARASTNNKEVGISS